MEFTAKVLADEITNVTLVSRNRYGVLANDIYYELESHYPIEVGDYVNVTDPNNKRFVHREKFLRTHTEVK